MKKQLLIMALTAAVFPALAQETNNVPAPPSDRQERKGEFSGKRSAEHESRKGVSDRFRDLSEEQKAEMQKKRIQLMEKTLTEIGVSEEQRAEIRKVQEAHKVDMKAASEKVNAAREALKKLEQSETATQEEIFAAIDTVSDAQAEQMKILARNRMEMEQLLGKEKFKQFMDAARKQYQKHGRRGGQGMPPMPKRNQPPPTP